MDAFTSSARQKSGLRGGDSRLRKSQPIDRKLWVGLAPLCRTNPRDEGGRHSWSRIGKRSRRRWEVTLTEDSVVSLPGRNPG